MTDSLFFVGLTYIAIAVFFGGLIYRAFSGVMGDFRGKWDWTARGDYLWTTRSTGFFGRASIGPASLCLHWGIILLFIAHVAGFVGGAYNLASWVEFFRWLGLGAGILFVFGVAWALVRRITIPQVRAMSTPDDYVILAFLLVIAGLGLYQSGVKLIFGISYAAGPWLASIFQLRPDIAAISGAPLVNKLHMILALLFFAWFPFTKLVHVISYPFGYMTRPFISMRRQVALKK